MDPVTHVATGLLLSQLIASPSRWVSAAAGVVFALLPDLDYFFFWWDRLGYIRFHRSISHSLLVVPLMALAVAGLGRAWLGPRWFRPLFCLGLAVLVVHVFLDLATSYGTQLFSPVSREKFTLDWLFIIDFYLTGLLAIGTAAALISPTWGRTAGLVSLALAAGYLAMCGFYHHHALDLARQVFQREAAQGATVAALSQPLSNRRWQLVAARPEAVKQALVELPYGGRPGGAVKVQEIEARDIGNPCPRAPRLSYRPPGDLQVLSWNAVQTPAVQFSPEARRILDIYLDFTRFPLFFWAAPAREGLRLEWLDLRFTVPGRAFPFVLQLYVDDHGRLLHWQIGGQCAG